MNSRARLSALIGLAGTIGLGALAGQAQATPGFSLNLSSPATAVVGQPFVVQASGTDPTDQGAVYLEVDAILGNPVSSCPSGYSDAEQLATASGGTYLAFSTPEDFDSTGSFSNPMAYTPTAPGRVLLCGYTDDGATDVLATASAITDVRAPASQGQGSGGEGSGQNSQAARPANLKKPHVTRSGKKLTCRRGSWSGNPSRYTYAWLVNGKQKAGAHGRRLAVTRKLRGHKIRCSVTASNASGGTTAVSPVFRVH